MVGAAAILFKPVVLLGAKRDDDPRFPNNEEGATVDVNAGVGEASGTSFGTIVDNEDTAGDIETGSVAMGATVSLSSVDGRGFVCVNGIDDAVTEPLWPGGFGVEGVVTGAKRLSDGGLLGVPDCVAMLLAAGTPVVAEANRDAGTLSEEDKPEIPPKDGTAVFKENELGPSEGFLAVSGHGEVDPNINVGADEVNRELDGGATGGLTSFEVTSFRVSAVVSLGLLDGSSSSALDAKTPSPSTVT